MIRRILWKKSTHIFKKTPYFRALICVEFSKFLFCKGLGDVLLCLEHLVTLYKQGNKAI